MSGGEPKPHFSETVVICNVGGLGVQLMLLTSSAKSRETEFPQYCLAFSDQVV